MRAVGPPNRTFGALAEEASPILTPREIEVLAAISDGLTNKAVARRLGISPHTVKFHIESLFRKLGAASRAEVVAKGRGCVKRLKSQQGGELFSLLPFPRLQPQRYFSLD